MIRNAGIEGSNFAATTRMPLVDPEDIARTAAEELIKLTTGKNVRYIVSDIRTGAEIAEALGSAIDKPGLPWITFSDDQARDGMMGAGVPRRLQFCIQRWEQDFVPARWWKTMKEMARL